MLSLGVDPKPAADPDFVGLADLNFRMILHESSLDRQFFGKPKIVRVEKGEIMAARDPRSAVSRCRYAPLRLLDQPQVSSEPG